MRVVNTSNVKWHLNKSHIRAGAGLKIKQLLRGRTGDPENYMFNMSHSAGDYGSPRHRHNFDQIRFVLDGDMRISPNQIIREGQIGYFPEGTTYGQSITDSCLGWEATNKLILDLAEIVNKL